MDFNFNCPFCNLALTIDEAGAGSEISCPGCKEVLIIPAPDQVGGVAAGGDEPEPGFSLPPPNKMPEAKIVKPSATLDVAAKASKKTRLKTIRHSDHVKDGKDLFDDQVSEFLAKTGDANVLSVHTVQYTLPPKDGTQPLTDYGVVIVYKS